MSDKNARPRSRIAGLLERLRRTWEAHPDLRLGQLVANSCSENVIYCVEDESLVTAIETIHPAGSATPDGDAYIGALAAPPARKHAHYFKPTPFSEADVYRVLRMFNVTDQNIGHAIKKLLLPGERGGGKDMATDIQEAIDTLVRWQELEAEDARAKGGA